MPRAGGAAMPVLARLVPENSFAKKSFKSSIPMGGETSFGRGAPCTQKLPANWLKCSGKHVTFRIRKVEGGSPGAYKYTVMDSSSNGTFVNGLRAPKGKELEIRDGDEISLSNAQDCNGSLVNPDVPEYPVFVFEAVSHMATDGEAAADAVGAKVKRTLEESYDAVAGEGGLGGASEEHKRPRSSPDAAPGPASAPPVAPALPAPPPPMTSPPPVALSAPPAHRMGENRLTPPQSPSITPVPTAATDSEAAIINTSANLQAKNSALREEIKNLLNEKLQLEGSHKDALDQETLKAAEAEENAAAARSEANAFRTQLEEIQAKTDREASASREREGALTKECRDLQARLEELSASAKQLEVERDDALAAASTRAEEAAAAATQREEVQAALSAAEESLRTVRAKAEQAAAESRALTDRLEAEGKEVSGQLEKACQDLHVQHSLVSTFREKMEQDTKEAAGFKDAAARQLEGARAQHAKDLEAAHEAAAAVASRAAEENGRLKYELEQTQRSQASLQRQLDDKKKEADAQRMLASQLRTALAGKEEELRCSKMQMNGIDVELMDERERHSLLSAQLQSVMAAVGQVEAGFNTLKQRASAVVPIDAAQIAAESAAADHLQSGYTPPFPPGIQPTPPASGIQPSPLPSPPPPAPRASPPTGATGATGDVAMQDAEVASPSPAPNSAQATQISPAPASAPAPAPAVPLVAAQEGAGGGGREGSPGGLSDESGGESGDSERNFCCATQAVAGAAWMGSESEDAFADADRKLPVVLEEEEAAEAAAEEVAGPLRAQDAEVTAAEEAGAGEAAPEAEAEAEAPAADAAVEEAMFVAAAEAPAADAGCAAEEAVPDTAAEEAAAEAPDVDAAAEEAMAAAEAPAATAEEVAPSEAPAVEEARAEAVAPEAAAAEVEEAEEAELAREAAAAEELTMAEVDAAAEEAEFARQTAVAEEAAAAAVEAPEAAAAGEAMVEEAVPVEEAADEGAADVAYAHATMAYAVVEVAGEEALPAPVEEAPKIVEIVEILDDDEAEEPAAAAAAQVVVLAEEEVAAGGRGCADEETQAFNPYLPPGAGEAAAPPPSPPGEAAEAEGEVEAAGEAAVEAGEAMEGVEGGDDDETQAPGGDETQDLPGGPGAMLAAMHPSLEMEDTPAPAVTAAGMEEDDGGGAPPAEGGSGGGEEMGSPPEDSPPPHGQIPDSLAFSPEAEVEEGAEMDVDEAAPHHVDEDGRLARELQEEDAGVAVTPAEPVEVVVAGGVTGYSGSRARTSMGPSPGTPVEEAIPYSASRSARVSEGGSVAATPEGGSGSAPEGTPAATPGSVTATPEGGSVAAIPIGAFSPAPGSVAATPEGEGAGGYAAATPGSAATAAEAPEGGSLPRPDVWLASAVESESAPGSPSNIAENGPSDSAGNGTPEAACATSSQEGARRPLASIQAAASGGDIARGSMCSQGSLGGSPAAAPVPAPAASPAPGGNMGNEDVSAPLVPFP